MHNETRDSVSTIASSSPELVGGQNTNTMFRYDEAVLVCLIINHDTIIYYCITVDKHCCNCILMNQLVINYNYNHQPCLMLVVL